MRVQTHAVFPPLESSPPRGRTWETTFHVAQEQGEQRFPLRDKHGRDLACQVGIAEERKTLFDMGHVIAYALARFIETAVMVDWQFAQAVEVRKMIAVGCIQCRAEARQTSQEMAEQPAQRYAMRWLHRWPLGSPVQLTGRDQRQQVLGALDLFGQLGQDQWGKLLRCRHSGVKLLAQRSEGKRASARLFADPAIDWRWRILRI